MSETNTQVLNPNQHLESPSRLDQLKELITAGNAGGGSENSLKSIKGLELSVDMVEASYSFSEPGEIPSSKRYVIHDVEEVHKEEDPLIPIGIPHLYVTGGEYITDSSLRFGRKHVPSSQTKRGLVLVDEPRFVIDKFNTSGELEDILVYSPDDLAELLDTAENGGRLNIDWEAQHTEPKYAESGETRIYLKINGNDPFDPKTGKSKVYDQEGRTREDQDKQEDLFDQITTELEKNNIYNWSGLSWETAWEEPDPDVMEPGAKKIIVHKVEIVREELITVPLGSETQPIRAFLMREVDSKGRVISCETLKDRELKTYFKKNENKVRNVNIGQPKIGEELDEETVEFTIPEYDLDAAPFKPWDHKQQERKEERHAELKAYVDRRMAEAAEILQREGDTSKREAMWLLGYFDTINASDEEAGAKQLAAMTKIDTETPDNERRLASVQAMIKEHSTAEVYGLALKLRNNFLATGKDLRLPVQLGDFIPGKKTDGSSVSWVIESLADASENPFTGPSAEKQQHDIVDRRIGLTFISKVLDRQPVPKPDTNEKGELVQRIDEKVVFDDQFLLKLPELTRDRIRELTEKIYHALEDGKVVQQDDLVKLGRWLGRGVGR
jgi:hypothetical protein